MRRLIAGAALALSLAVPQAGHPASPPSLIAFQRLDLIYTMRGDGTARHRVTGNRRLIPLAWWPGGRSLLVWGARLSKTPGTLEPQALEILRLDGRIARVITRRRELFYAAAVSPNGRHVVYSSGTNRASALSMIDADGTHRRLIQATGAGPVLDLAWSPDGTRIAYGRRGRIWLMDAAGRHRRAIVTQRGSAQPAWSPDGSQIAFSGSDPTGKTTLLYVAKADGSDVKALTRDVYPDYGSDPSWSRDGARIAFEAGELEPAGRSTSHIELVAPDGTGRRQLTLARSDRSPMWQPPLG